MNYHVGDLIQVTVGEVAHGGWCVARPGQPGASSPEPAGPAVFTRHALPGETVVARVTEVASKLLRAEAVEILTASPDRVRPPCPHAGPGGCGGCDWQHATLPAQRSLKAAVIRQQLRRMAGLDREITVEPLPGDEETPGDVAAGDGLAWRTRVQFAVRDDGVAGLRAHRSHRVIDVGTCLIAHPALTDLGITARRWPGAASVEALVSPASGERAVIMSVVSGGRTQKPPQTPPRLGGPIPPDPPCADSVLRRKGRRLAPVRGRGYLTQHAAGRDWRVSPGAFWQVHPGAADALAAAVLTGLEPRPGDAALDLYCGVGLFAGVLARAVGSSGTVIGVEASRAAVRDARHNLREWPWARVRAGDVAEVLTAGSASSGRADPAALPSARLVAADPPRSGLAREVIEYLGTTRSGAARLAYVSCDPATLARDIGLLGERGWHLDDLRAFDAFPMTHHVECVATLSRTPALPRRNRLLRGRVGVGPSGDEVAESGYAVYQALLFQDAQRLGARLPGMPEFLAQRGDGWRRHAWRQGPVRDLPAKPRGQADVRPWV